MSKLREPGRRLLPVLLWLLLVVGSPDIPAAPAGCASECGADLDCEIEAVGCLISKGRTREAIERSKARVAANPGDPIASRMLARSYVADDNPFWAERTLLASNEQNPDDWEGRAWLAWIRAGQGDLELAGQTLEGPPEPGTDSERTRQALLESFIASLQEDDERAREALGRGARGSSIYPEDRELLRMLQRRVDPSRVDPLTLDLESQVGHTTNAFAGSPVDLGESGPSSTMGRVRLDGRLLVPRPSGARPSVELMVHGYGLEDPDAEELSYLELSARPGVVLGRKHPLLLAYRGEWLYLNDDPSDFFRANRLEAELDLGRFAVFAGGGRRRYEERIRTREEIDAGVAGTIWGGSRTQLLFGTLFRYHAADAPVYDLTGGTALVLARFAVHPRFGIRLYASYSLDDYPHSGGVEGFAVFGSLNRRRDDLLRGFIDLTTPLGRGVEAGLRYQSSRRNSTVSEPWGKDYDYEEGRILFLLRWRFRSDPWGPKLVDAGGRVPLPYGLGGEGEGGFAEERIQDLLRQDQEFRRGST